MAYDIFSDVVKDAKVDQIHAICVLKGKKLFFREFEIVFYFKMAEFFTGGYRFFSDMLNKLNALNVSNLTESNSGKNGDSVQISIEFIRIKSYHDDK